MGKLIPNAHEFLQIVAFCILHNGWKLIFTLILYLIETVNLHLPESKPSVKA